MSSRAFATLLLLLFIARPALAVQPSIVVHKLAVDITVRADGTATITEHREQTPSSTATAAQIGQYALGFNPTMQRLEVTEAYTQKHDGHRLLADLGQIRSQLVPGVPNSPMFSDVQEKVVVFPDLAEGDTQVLTYRQETIQPLFAGNFFWQAEFGRTTAWEDVAITITAPSSYKLITESFDVPFSSNEQDGVTTYRWTYHAPEVIAEDIAALSSWDRLPRIFVSSFPDYSAMAAAYARLAEPKTVVTPRVQAKADEITAGIDDRRAQARAIYEWVSLHIRYVALYLGAGGVDPHAADEILANGYGDCKDHTVLFAALLRAKGIPSNPVLVNLGNAYSLSTPPTMAQLNHAISYLPEFDLYADTTSGVTAFGTLPFQEYGKPAVIVGAEGEALRHLPLLEPGLASITTTTQAHLDLDGAILGTTRTEATGPAAAALRLTARWVQTAGHEGAARQRLVALGEPGTGIFQFASPENLSPSYAIDGKFTLDPQPEILEGDSFAPALGLQILIRPGDFLIGPLNRPTLSTQENTPCFSGRQIEDLALDLPEGQKPQRLPKDRHIENPAFTYTTHWSMDGQTLRVRREFTTSLDQPLCTGKLRQEAATALTEIRRDHRAKVVLAVP